MKGMKAEGEDRAGALPKGRITRNDIIGIVIGIAITVAVCLLIARISRSEEGGDSEFTVEFPAKPGPRPEIERKAMELGALLMRKGCADVQAVLDPKPEKSDTLLLRVYCRKWHARDRVITMAQPGKAA